MKRFLRKLIPDFLISWYHFAWVFLGAVIYGFPSKKLRVIGVTGTNGKSTVVFLIEKILEKAGYKVGAISSIKFKLAEKEWPNTLKMTMPGRMKCQKFLWQANRAGCQYAILEVTSEGIKQHRHRFIDFDMAVLTNLTPEHLEAHGSFEKYKEAKGKLFKALKQKGKIIINLDDLNAEYFLQFKADEKYGHRIKNQSTEHSKVLSARCSAEPINMGSGQELRIKNRFVKNVKIIEAQEIELKENYSSFIIHNSLFKIHLLGQFNIYNALSAISVGLAEGIPLAKIKSALEEVKGIPGRLEIVIKEPFTVIVDYAHTPDALEKVYQTIQDTRYKIQDTKIIGVLGACGGGRDKWKRPKLGEIAAQYCDEIILTNEDPYDEDPEEILTQIEKGIKNYVSGFRFQVWRPDESRRPISDFRQDSNDVSGFRFRVPCKRILDRRKAIRKALDLAKPGDMVIITGKGCEPWICLAKGTKIPWDDRQVVREEFKKAAHAGT